MIRDFLLVNSILINAKLDIRLDIFEINQVLRTDDARKLAETLENYSGCWRLFGVLEVHTTSH